MNMRRKPQQSGSYNNQHRRNRHGGGQGNNTNHNRQRKNYPALREKYLTQARDALASGERVLAENYFQHADHCYRMMLEDGYRPHQQQENSAQENENKAESAGEEPSQTASVLPAFLTVNYDAAAQAPVDPATVQNWEDRDA